jgi:hypothetical protein
MFELHGFETTLVMLTSQASLSSSGRINYDSQLPHDAVYSSEQRWVASGSQSAEHNP